MILSSRTLYWREYWTEEDWSDWSEVKKWSEVKWSEVKWEVELLHRPENRLTASGEIGRLYLEFRTMGKVQKRIDSECYTPSLESFKLNL
jgi:hypothetical protein